MTRTICSNLLLALALMTLPAHHARADDPIPSIDASVAAWYTARDWVSAFAVPRDAPEQRIDHAVGCSIILRQGGRIVGTGEAEADEGRMLQRATGRALRDAMADPAMAAIPPELRDGIGARLTVELELAGPMQPLIGDDPNQFRNDIHPLRHGLALRLQDQWTIKYPSRLRSMNRWPDAAMLDGMAISLGLTSGLRDALGRNDVVAYRFQTIDLAQTAPDAPPQLIDGGTMRHPPSNPDRTVVATALESLLGHVEQRFWPGDEPLGLMGSYEPAADRFEPIVAPRREQALVAWALGRVATADSSTRTVRDRASDAAATLLVGLLAPVDADDTALAEEAAVLLAMEGNRSLDPERLDPKIAAARAALRSRIDAMLEQDELPSGQDLAFIGFVLASGDCEHDGASARRLLDLAWERTQAAQQVSLLPWIAWAEFAMPRCGQDGRIDELRMLRTMVLDRQVPPGDERFGTELVGGIVLGQTAVDVTAQSLRPFASMPALLNHRDATTTEERDRQQMRLLMAIRYLLQLQAGTEDAALHRSPDRVVGGIRMAPWDSRMPTIAQALALVTLSETLEILPADSPGIPGDRGLY